MSLLIKAAVLGGLAYAVTRAMRSPAVKEFLGEDSNSGSFGSGMGSGMKSELHPDESLFPTAHRANTGPSS